MSADNENTTPEPPRIIVEEWHSLQQSEEARQALDKIVRASRSTPHPYTPTKDTDQ